MKISLFFLLIILALPVLSQESTSVHKNELDHHNKYFTRTPVSEPENIIPLQFDKSPAGSKVVFGFLPYWEYPGALSYLRYDLLTHISTFDFQIDSLGNVTNPSGWPWTNLINAAHQNGVKVIMTAVNFTSSQIRHIITNSAAKQNFFSKVKATLMQYSLDGVNIDFEGLYTADRGSVINGFMTDLTAYIHTELPGKEVSFAGPAVNWSGWNLAGLAAACDYIFIMGYDFSGSWSTVTAPTAPLTGGAYNITNTITVQYGACPPEKLVLGVPYYGCEWVANTNQPGATISSYLGHPRFYAAMDQSQYYGLQWHTASQTVYYTIPVNNKYNQVWFDDGRSTGLKFSLANQYNLRGVGMWALGYDRDRQELWTELNKYLNPSSVNEDYNSPESFQLAAYPNPFNPSTTVAFTHSGEGNVKISMFDLLGRTIMEREYENLPEGEHKEFIDARALNSGVYFVRVTGYTKSGMKTSIVKLVLTK